MGHALGKIGDRLLARVLPQAAAAGCIPPSTYYECVYPHSCNDNREMTQLECELNCGGHATCWAVGCC